MTDRVEKVFVGPGIKGGEIDVINLLNVLDHVIEFNGVGASAKERVSGFEPGEEFEGFDELAHGVALLLESFPLAFPHDDRVVALSEQGSVFESGGFVEVTHDWSQIVTHLVTDWKHLGHPCQKQLLNSYTVRVPRSQPSTKKVLAPRRITCFPPLLACRKSTSGFWLR